MAPRQSACWLISSPSSKALCLFGWRAPSCGAMFEKLPQYTEADWVRHVIHLGDGPYTCLVYLVVFCIAIVFVMTVIAVTGKLARLEG